jgi:hypothetical protein
MQSKQSKLHPVVHRQNILTAIDNPNIFKNIKNSLIFHEEKAKEITAGGFICDKKSCSFT